MPVNRHIVVIDPGTGHPELDTFNQLVLREKSRFCFTYHQPALNSLESLYDLQSGFDGCIVLGSGASVYDQPEWQIALVQWLQEKVIAERIPLLGICYGHQLIAHMYGARVAFLSQQKTKLKGLRAVKVAQGSTFPEHDFSLYVSHREVVLECPKGFIVSLRSDVCDIEGLLHSDLPLATVAGHPEATSGFLRNQNIKYEGGFEQGHEFMTNWFDAYISS
jgi:GMP synthase (glutamine-hydrolysing)